MCLIFLETICNSLNYRSTLAVLRLALMSWGEVVCDLHRKCHASALRRQRNQGNQRTSRPARCFQRTLWASARVIAVYRILWRAAINRMQTLSEWVDGGARKLRRYHTASVTVHLAVLHPLVADTEIPYLWIASPSLNFFFFGFFQVFASFQCDRVESEVDNARCTELLLCVKPSPPSLFQLQEIMVPHKVFL